MRLQIWVCLICVFSPHLDGAVQIRVGLELAEGLPSRSQTRASALLHAQGLLQDMGWKVTPNLPQGPPKGPNIHASGCTAAPQLQSLVSEPQRSRKTFRNEKLIWPFIFVKRHRNYNHIPSSLPQNLWFYLSQVPVWKR